MSKGKNTTLYVVIAVVLVIAIAIAAVVIFYVKSDNIKENKMATVLKDDEVVAKIMDTEFKYNLVNIMGQYESSYGIQDPNARQQFWTQAQGGVTMLDQIKEFALEQTKYQKVEYIKAKENNIELSKEEKAELESYYDSIEEQFESSGESTLEEYLEGYFGISLKQFKRFTEESSVAGKFSEEQMEAMEVTDEDAKERYEEDEKLFDTVDVRHVLLTTVNLETGEELAEEIVTEKEELANEILAKIESGEDMEALVEEYSEDTGKEENNGLYSINNSSSFVTSFKTWALEAEPGDTGIVESEYGYHIMSCEDRTEFEEVKANVINKMKQEMYSEKLEQWVSEYDFEVYDNVYDEVNPLAS